MVKAVDLTIQVVDLGLGDSAVLDLRKELIVRDLAAIVFGRDGRQEDQRQHSKPGKP